MAVFTVFLSSTLENKNANKMFSAKSRFGTLFLMLLRPKMSLKKSYPKKIHKVTTFGPKSVKIADPLPKTKYTALVSANFWTPPI